MDFILGAFTAAMGLRVGWPTSLVFFIPAFLYIRLVMLRLTYVHKAAEAMAYSELLVSLEKGDINIEELRQKV